VENESESRTLRGILCRYVRYVGTLQLSETMSARNEDVVGG